MKKAILKTLVKWNRHGKRHQISGHYLDTKAYEKNARMRLVALGKWMHDNGLGA